VGRCPAYFGEIVDRVSGNGFGLELSKVLLVLVVDDGSGEGERVNSRVLQARRKQIWDGAWAMEWKIRWRTSYGSRSRSEVVESGELADEGLVRS
jgi:hypothetical protein